MNNAMTKFPHHSFKSLAALLLAGAVPLFASASQEAQNWTAEFSPDGGRDRGPEVRSALKSGARLRFAPGEYRFSVKSMPRRADHISNHDQPPDHPIAIPVVGLSDVLIDGPGARFVIDGNAIAIACVDSARCRINGVSIEYSRSHNIEAKILGFESGETRVSIDRAAYPWTLDAAGRLRFNDGMGGSFGVTTALLFDGETTELLEGTADVVLWGGGAKVREAGDGELILPMDFSSVPRQVKNAKSVKAGDIIMLRNWGRENPAIFLYRATGTRFKDVSIHSSCGMGLLAQRSRDVSFTGSTPRPESTDAPWRAGAGVFPLEGRYSSTAADATHFSNCSGEIVVSDCLFQGMADDAINVHSTCLAIEEKLDARRLRCRYRHHQSVGFEVFAPGEKLRFIKGPTLEDGPTAEVAGVEVVKADEVIITLAGDAPEGYGKGDAVENADWQPSVVFSGNVVRHNRARGALFNAPRPVRCMDNVFERVSGSAILLAGDAQGWYESGACRDVVISGNLFRDNLTSAYQFTSAVVSIYPEVRRIDEQTRRYHGKVVIEDNTFETFDVPLLYAHSVEEVYWRRNTVLRNDRYSPRKGKAINYHHCGKVEADVPLQ